MEWQYKDRELSEDEITSNFGFVYLLTEIKTGKKYIGSKQFAFHHTKPALKGQKRKRKVTLDSGWRDYYSSNKTVQQLAVKNGGDSFHREILHLCDSKAIMLYVEAAEIIARSALTSDCYYNEYLMLRVNSSHLKNLKIIPK